MFFPAWRRGDSLEFFFSSRSEKSPYLTKYHHHFVFFPEKVEGVLAKEVTRFHFNDLHELADPKELFVTVENRPQGYILEAFLPAKVLFGYNPEHFSKVGFSYQINRFRSASTAFSVRAGEYALEKHPALWSFLVLKK
ncbi:MAG: hypothetical protein WC371_02365 [Parachlamydiales bacterium]